MVNGVVADLDSCIRLIVSPQWNTTNSCSRIMIHIKLETGIWIHVKPLPESGSLLGSRSSKVRSGFITRKVGKWERGLYSTNEGRGKKDIFTEQMGEGMRE